MKKNTIIYWGRYDQVIKVWSEKYQYSVAWNKEIDFFKKPHHLSPEYRLTIRLLAHCFCIKTHFFYFPLLYLSWQAEVSFEGRIKFTQAFLQFGWTAPLIVSIDSKTQSPNIMTTMRRLKGFLFWFLTVKLNIRCPILQVKTWKHTTNKTFIHHRWGDPF